MTTIRSIRVFSAAKVNAFLYGILGLLTAPLLLLGPGLAMIGGTEHAAGFGSTIFLALFLPFCYAVFGFVVGALLAFVYNAIAHAVGGIEVELQTESQLVNPVTPALEQTSLTETQRSTPPEFE